ncbi:hypothetical protein BS78_08G127900 [Paspalum vaginatum]|nr:hypothetical protein BS78_08G127900 [Paspalum vaginatum]
MGNHKKLLQFLRPEPAAAAAAAEQPPPSSDDEDDDYAYSSTATTPTTPSTSTNTSAAASPYAMSPWTSLPGLEHGASNNSKAATGLLGSLVKADGHVYSLAAAGELLYTGTDSRTVRVWRDRRELPGAGLRAGSGLVKAILVCPDGRIYTGHQDGKVRVWRRRAEPDGSGGASESEQHRRVGSLPGLRDVLRSALRPSKYVQTRRRGRSALWMRHVDAVSSLSLDAAAGLIYSASWDRTFKVWRAADSRCLESVHAHADAVNAVAAAGFDALVLTGSADGTVKVWRRQARGRDGRDTWHTAERVLREGGDGAVTAVAVAPGARVVYVGSSDGAVAHWQWRRGAPRGAAPRNGGALWGHRAAVLCLAVAGRVVVSGSADRSVCVWRRTEGADHARVAVLTGHTGPVKCVAMDEEEVAEDGARRSWVVYSGSLDGSVKVWRVADGGGAREDSAAATTPARTPAASAWTKGASPSPTPRPLRRWAPYAASPETERAGAAWA